ncbi:hypothetical protein NPIL_623451 [Nephila pilipes]|uniref:Uncharacterized protein n=1 Tax=Nephila pilipes TaxID=299642 RepID=A0A8X6NEA8_NEPPI|nr:hypothetical protein NPIL_623451 [Nephila pilipes]
MVYLERKKAKEDLTIEVKKTSKHQDIKEDTILKKLFLRVTDMKWNQQRCFMNLLKRETEKKNGNQEKNWNSERKLKEEWENARGKN